MRSFEERKAEVLRRSENRIKERKKARSRALAVCIPLCLIITVWSVMVLPAMLPVNNKKSGATDERAENTSGAAYSQNEYVRIETKNSATKDQTAVLKDDPSASRPQRPPWRFPSAGRPDSRWRCRPPGRRCP